MPRDPVRLEWNINFSGIDPKAKYRVDIMQYYETVPDEAKRDNYCPRKHKVAGDPDSALKMVHSSGQHHLALPSTKPSKNVVMEKIKHYARHLLPPMVMAGATALTGNPLVGEAAGAGVGMMLE